ncbi:hypothetical protein J437_LFUL008872 [Ladona fulva]|uniref:PNT domain-containing protein n=1 Tax=Ladona fulva TaxID=123851 RepID=A0A8K0P3P7_LADFU|nr:hypothetical protein J437_LFUL008872 [Ladona fulva]
MPVYAFTDCFENVEVYFKYLLFFISEESGLIMQHMDIREPLSTLRSLLEQRIGMDLSDYQFWLQDAQMLESHKNLVDQCVQGEGIVQVNVEIKILGDIKKINIVDVLKPADEYLELADEINDVDEATANAPEHVVRWIMDPQFRKDQERLRIPFDPVEWTVPHVRHWLQWAVRQFNLVGIRLADWGITGERLCSLSVEEFQQIVPNDPGDIFWTHLELLRRCKFVEEKILKGEIYMKILKLFRHVFLMMIR